MGQHVLRVTGDLSFGERRRPPPARAFRRLAAPRLGVDVHLLLRWSDNERPTPDSLGEALAALVIERNLPAATLAALV